MANCKDCIHYDVCGGYTLTDLDYDVFDYAKKGIPDEIPDIEERCAGFKNKADVVPRSEVEKATQEVAREIFEEIKTNLNNLIRYYKEKRKYVTEVDYNEAEQRYCDIKIITFEERLLKIAELKKKYIGE